MNDQTDSQLLCAYAENHSETAFAELVRRHVDFVYSAARRMVVDPHLAEDVTQSVFVAFAKNARQLADRPMLSGWLHRTAQNIAAQTVRTIERRRAREQEAAAMNELLAHESDADWKNIAPHLDTALGELSEPDRDALLLRYFERKSAREMAQVLNVTEEAAQKRVNRAVERLREFFSKRNVTVGASGLAVLISANAVQAAPIGLALSISTVVGITGTVLQTSTAIAVTKTIAMTTFQKTLIATALVVATGAGVYEARQASNLQKKLDSQQQEKSPQSPQVEQIQKLQAERENLTRQIAALTDENERLKKTVAEVPRLRGDLVRSRSALEQSQSRRAAMDPNDPVVKDFLAAKTKADQIGRYLQQMPEKTIPEISLLTDVDWLATTKEAKLDTDADVRKTLQTLRMRAKGHLPFGSALSLFTQANNGELPTDISQLKPWFKSLKEPNASVDDATLDAIFGRYKLLHTGNVKDFPEDTWFIAEKAPVDKDYDSRAKFGIGRSSVTATGIKEDRDTEDKSY